jgi:hypothetical protein
MYVVQGAHGSPLCYTTAFAVGVVDINLNAVSASHHITEKYLHLFEGIGKLKDFDLKLHINEWIPPVAQPAQEYRST